MLGRVLVFYGVWSHTCVTVSHAVKEVRKEPNCQSSRQGCLVAVAVAAAASAVVVAMTSIARQVRENAGSVERNRLFEMILYM